MDNHPRTDKEVTRMDRFDLYAAFYIFCTDYHSGQASRGYRILSRLTKAGYNPGLSVQRGFFENEEQYNIYNQLVNRYAKYV